MELNWIKDILLPFLVATTTYVLITKLDEWRKRKSHSKLGVVIIESLIEEVRTGRDVISDAQKPEANLTNPLPKKSWSGMTTIPDDVLLRIIEVSERSIPKSFPPREIRIHCKNYFEHMTLNWENDVLIKDGGANWRANARVYQPCIFIAQKVLDMLTQSKELLIANSKKWMPK